MGSKHFDTTCIESTSTGFGLFVQNTFIIITMRIPYYFHKILKNISTHNTDKSKIMLGRWGNTGNNIKNIYANHDHCGDIICKNPKEIREIIKNEIKNK